MIHVCRNCFPLQLLWVTQLVTANLPLHVSHFNCCLYAPDTVILDCGACYICHLLYCWQQHWAPCYQVCCLISDDGSLIILLQYSLASTLCPPRAYHCHWLCPGKHGVDAVFSNIVISALCWSITSCGGGQQATDSEHNPFLSPVWSTGLQGGAVTGSARLQQNW